MKRVIMQVLVLALYITSLCLADDNQYKYKVIDLGDLGGIWSCAYSINSSNEIVGWAENEYPLRRAVMFNYEDPNAIFEFECQMGHSHAIDINENHRVVGSIPDENYHDRPTLFSGPLGPDHIDLGTLGGDKGIAISINIHKLIVGWANDQIGQRHAVLFDSTGGGDNFDLGTLGGGYSIARDINDCNEVVGQADNGAGFGRAVIFDMTIDPIGGNKNIDLGTLGGDISFANTINNAGQIVGYATNGSGYKRATLFDPNGDGHNVDLGTLGGTHGWAWFISEEGHIVGAVTVPTHGTRATWFDRTGGGHNYNINDLVDPNSEWTLKYVYSMNEKGWMVGQGVHKLPAGRAFLLMPKSDEFLLLMAPNGGQMIRAGTTYTILWETVGEVDEVLIEYSTNNGQDWTVVDPPNSGNTGSYQWESVPIADSNDCLIRISDVDDPNINDTSDSTFIIYECHGPLIADFNNDCYTNLFDFTILAEKWLQTVSTPLGDIAPPGGDGIINILDLALYTTHWLECGNRFDPACIKQP